MARDRETAYDHAIHSPAAWADAVTNQQIAPQQLQTIVLIKAIPAPTDTLIESPILFEINQYQRRESKSLTPGQGRIFADDDNGQIEFDEALNRSGDNKPQLADRRWMNGATMNRATASTPTADLPVQYKQPQTPLSLTFLVARSITKSTSMRLLRVLFDTGGDATMDHERILLTGCTPTLEIQPAYYNHPRQVFHYPMQCLPER